MRNKRKRRIRNYMAVMLCTTICILLFLRHFVDFFLGFFAGFNGVDAEYASSNYGVLSQVAGWATIVVIILAGTFIYYQIRKKIAQPIEQLAEGMQEVSRGNLEIRIPVNGEFEFMQMQEAFNMMVGELEQEKRSRELLEKRNRQLYAGIAHDLKTPMTMVVGYARLLESGQELSRKDKQKYLQTIIEQTEHTNELLDSLLAYAKLENQSYQMRRENRDIVECLRACVADYYPSIEEAGIQMELGLPENQVFFSYDEVEMKRVFMNLLSNLVKHNPPNTSCLIQLEEKSDEKNNERMIQVIVADDGPKIAEELQEVLFDTFAVGDYSRNTKNGSGLGLAISKKIIEGHDGELYYINEMEKGFKGFVIMLPQKGAFTSKEQIYQE